MRETFIIKSAWKGIFDDLNDKQAGVLIKAVFNYMATGEKPTELSDLEIKMAFKFMAIDLDTFKEKYETKCAVNKENGTKGADFGKLGGRPRKSEKTPKNPQRGYDNPENPERPLTDNDKDTDKDNDLNTVTFSDEKDNSSGELARAREIDPISEPNRPKRKKEKSCAKKEKDVIEVEVCEAVDPFRQVVDEWFEYKRERKESYKSAKSQSAFIDKLRELSGGDTAIARKIIQQSIANNWAGIFELKPQSNVRGKNSVGVNPCDDYEFMQEVAAGAERGRKEREERMLRDQQLRYR